MGLGTAEAQTMSGVSNTPSVLDLEPLVVWWEEEPERTRKVVRGCKVCGGDISEPLIVSPSGVAHESSGVNDGTTDCGKDATGADWWWRL